VGESETVESRIDEGIFKITPHSDDMVKFKLLDEDYYLNSSGQLFEKANDRDKGFSVIWNLKKFEGE
jgi:hypothetical protein